jgi:L-lactate dehydrogenase complex protein LldF
MQLPFALPPVSKKYYDRNFPNLSCKNSNKAADLDHRRKINFNINKYNAKVPEGKEQFADLALARERAKNTKWRAIETLDQQLESFELQFTKEVARLSGRKTLNRPSTKYLNICREKNCKKLVKSKSMVTEEIHLNVALEKNGIESVETDLGNISSNWMARLLTIL